MPVCLTVHAPTSQYCSHNDTMPYSTCTYQPVLQPQLQYTLQYMHLPASTAAIVTVYLTVYVPTSQYCSHSDSMPYSICTYQPTRQQTSSHGFLPVNVICPQCTVNGFGYPPSTTVGAWPGLPPALGQFGWILFYVLHSRINPVWPDMIMIPRA